MTRDGTAEPVSRDQILRPARTGTGKIFIFPDQLITIRIGNPTRLILPLAIIYDDHTYYTILLCGERTGDSGKTFFPCSADHEQDCQPYTTCPVDAYQAL